MALFNIGKQNIPTPSEEFNKMLGAENIEDDKSRIIQLSIDLLDEIKAQPFKFRQEKAQQMVESILEVGVLEPILVRQKKNGRYDIIAGRHRTQAAKLAGLTTVPCMIKDVNKDTAALILLSTNTDRNNEYSYSELANAYKQQYELLKKIGSNSPSISKIAEQNNTNRKKIQRYIRLNELIIALLKLVDTRQLPFMAGVELSYLDKDDQNTLFAYMLSNKVKLSLEQSKHIRKAAETGKLNNEKLKDILEPQKEPLPQLEGQINIEEYSSEETVQNNIQPQKIAKEEAPETAPIIIDKPEDELEEKSIGQNKQNKGDYITHTDIKIFIKAFYNTEELFEYYAFNAPTPTQAIKEKLRKNTKERLKVNYAHGGTGDVTFLQNELLLSYSAGTGYVLYKDIDKCVRELIQNNLLLPGEKMLDTILKHFEKMGLKK